MVPASTQGVRSKRKTVGMNNALVRALVVVLLLGGCARPVKVELPQPLSRDQRAQADEGDRALVAPNEQRLESLRRTGTPTSNYEPAVAGTGSAFGVPPVRGEPLSANIEGMPVPAFINEFFGTILGVGFQLDPAVAKMSDLVTLRTPGPLPPSDFYQLAVRVLRTYGVEARYEGDRVRFLLAGRGDAFEPPLVLSGRAAPEVPISHRPIFQLVELSSVRNADVTNWLKLAFRTDGLEIQDDLNRNAVVLFGRPEIVRQAAAAIRVLDRPFMRGRVSTRIEPAFVSAEELAAKLVDVLRAEGYAAAVHGGGTMPTASSILVMPMGAANTVLVFAGEANVLEHVVQWARTIDTPNPVGGDQSLFYYTVRNTSAQDVVSTLNGVRGTSRSGIQPARNSVSSAQANARSGADLVSGQQPVAAQTPASTEVPSEAGVSSGRLILDAPRNAIIYRGDAQDWARLLPLIRQMDRAARQVMIEVTIAEVSLDKDEQFGVSWLSKVGPSGYDGTITSGTLGATEAFSGLTYLLDVAGQTRARLRAFAEDSRVTVLSSPRLMVKSGEQASIDVGTEIPTLSSQSASNQQTDGNTNILQSIQYRKTGIILDIKPIVYSDDRIDLEIRQEVSEALPLGANSAVQSPSIFNRAVSSNLSLRDGSSILIGGLMSNRSTVSNDGVPYLKDVPLLGSLFRSTSRNNTRTELVLMIVPYIVESDGQAVELTRSLGERLQFLDLPSMGAEPSPVSEPSYDPSLRPGSN